MLFSSIEREWLATDLAFKFAVIADFCKSFFYKLSMKNERRSERSELVTLPFLSTARNDKATFRVKNHQHQSKIEPWGIALINDCHQSNVILLAQKITRNSWNLDLTLADSVFGRIPPFEQEYCEEYITYILPINH